jgi:hypothetical protein
VQVFVRFLMLAASGKAGLAGGIIGKMPRSLRFDPCHAPDTRLSSRYLSEPFDLDQSRRENLHVALIVATVDDVTDDL